jgi:uncharacterized protein YacL
VYITEILYVSLGINLGTFNRIKYLLGIIIALASVWSTNKVSRQIYLSLRQIVIRLSLADFVIGIISIIIGLLLGALATTPFSSISGSWTWLLSFVVVVISTVLAVWTFNLKKQIIIDWFNSLHLFQHQSLENTYEKEDRAKFQNSIYINPMILDTSAIIDARIGELIKSGFLYGTILLPSFILEELQQVADSTVAEKRQRGRLGLKLLQQIKRSKRITVVSPEEIYPDIDLVDSKLVQLATDYKAKIITCDYNLNAVAKVRGVAVLNINELAANLRHQYLPGEKMQIKVVQAGREDGQGLGYLTDGTLVVIQKGKPFIGKEIKVEIQRILQNAAGRMIFVKTLSERSKESK